MTVYCCRITINFTDILVCNDIYSSRAYFLMAETIEAFWHGFGVSSPTRSLNLNNFRVTLSVNILNYMYSVSLGKCGSRINQ